MRANSGARTGLPASVSRSTKRSRLHHTALDAGGLGYVVKARLASDLLPAILAALVDRRFISPLSDLNEFRIDLDS